MTSKGKTVASRKFSRSNEERIRYIHTKIRSGKKPTCEGLAKETGFSRDVILEDIKYLKEFEGLPLKVTRKGGRTGYYYAGDVPEMIGRTFNERGVINMAIANRALATLPVVGSTGLGLDMETIRQLLVPHTRILMDAVSETVFFRPFAPEAMKMNMFVTLSEGVRDRREMAFCYTKNLAQMPELKRVQGYCFLCAASSWYMVGRDVEKDELRTYLLSRLSEPLLSDKTFEEPKFDLDEYLDGAFIVMKAKESHDIVVEFSPWAATYIENRRFTRDQKIEKLSNGGLRISFWLSCLDEVECWVRYWGANCKVIGSEGLKDRLRKYRDSLAYLG